MSDDPITPENAEPLTLISELSNRYDLAGIEVVNNESGVVETTLTFSRDEVDFPGYVESVERGYLGTGWTTRRIWSKA